jgi:hypothetical protein
MVASSLKIAHSGWKHKRHQLLRADRIFLGILITASILLSGLSIRFSRLLSIEGNETSISAKSNASFAVGEVSPSVDTTGKYANDRVYCMVPFIWNKEIYEVSEFCIGPIINQYYCYH